MCIVLAPKYTPHPLGLHIGTCPKISILSVLGFMAISNYFHIFFSQIDFFSKEANQSSWKVSPDIEFGGRSEGPAIDNWQGTICQKLGCFLK